MIVDIYTTDKKYNVIYADPPWKYKTWTEGGGTAEKHYPTMKLDDIIKNPYNHYYRHYSTSYLIFLHFLTILFIL